MRGARYLTPKLAVAIFLAPGPRKKVAHEFGVSLTAISLIKSGKRWGDVTRPYSRAAAMNATLISMACGVTP